MREGWLIDRDDCWIWRFHHDSTSRNKAGVFIDRGRRMPSDPPLLKERRHLTDRAAEQMWLSLQTQGWKPLEEPAWGGQQQMSEDHGSAATRYPAKNPQFLSVKPGMTVVVTEEESWWMGNVLFMEGGARNPKVPTLFQVADVDDGTVRWVCADLVTHIVPRV